MKRKILSIIHCQALLITRRLRRNGHTKGVQLKCSKRNGFYPLIGYVTLLNQSGCNRFCLNISGLGVLIVIVYVTHMTLLIRLNRYLDLYS